MDLFLFNAGPARKYAINMETSELQHLDFFLRHWPYDWEGEGIFTLSKRYMLIFIFI